MIRESALKALGIIAAFLTKDLDSNVKYRIKLPLAIDFCDNDLEFAKKKEIIFSRMIDNGKYEEYMIVPFDDIFDSLKNEYGSVIYDNNNEPGWHYPVKCDMTDNEFSKPKHKPTFDGISDKCPKPWNTQEEPI